jgi:hypothetical protein
MEVTRSPTACKSTPMLLAVTPFPKPLTTPPVTSKYFIFTFRMLLIRANERVGYSTTSKK